MGASSWCQSALLVLTIASAAFWIGAGVLFARGSRRIPGLGSAGLVGAPAGAAPAPALPSLTIVVAAKDEEARVEQAARSLLAQDYPRLQVIAVDDRSTDATGAILDRVAAEDPRLRALHVAALPEGWLGKCHALARGAAEARGDWILFTDGDVLLAPEAARRAVSLALGEGADHLAVAPDLEVAGLGEAIFVGYFVALFNISQRPWDAPNPRSKAHIGIGAFNLVRKEAYVRSGGHERLRMELLDDMGLGLIVKERGARSLFARHDEYVRARWHAGVGGLVRGVEKNAFPALGYRVGATVGAVALQLAGSLAPLAGLVAPDPATRVAAIAAWGGVVLVYAVTSRYAAVRPWQALFMPVGAVLFGYAILASMAATVARGGVVWRGTFYPLERLKAGRVR